jgi:hypothetical protein
MNNGEKTRKQLLIELISLRKRINELETLELHHKRNEEALLKNHEQLMQRLRAYDEFYAISNGKDRMILELKDQLEKLRLGLGH